MAYTDKEWATARAFFERGLSLAEIVEREEVSIKSKSQISKKSKAEGWIKEGEKKRLFEKDVEIKQAVIEIKKQKETLCIEERNVHEVLVDERTRHIQFFNDAAVRNVEQSMSVPCESQNDFRARADTIAKGREVVLGKAAETQVNIQNNQITRIERVIVRPNQ